MYGILIFIVSFIVGLVVLNALFPKKVTKHCVGPHKWIYKHQADGWERLVCDICGKIPGEDHDFL